MARLYKLGPRSLFPSTAIGAVGGTYYGANLPLVEPSYSYANSLTSYFSAGTEHVCATVAQFTTALANCVSGDIITLTAGNTFSGVFTLRNLGANSRVLIRSSAHASLPSPGTRVSPSDAANMPIVRANTANVSVFDWAAGANGYYFVGINFREDAGSSTTSQMVAIGNRDRSVVDDEAYNIFIDRCYFSSRSGHGCSRTLQLHARYVVVRDSYIYCYPYNGLEQQAIWGTNGTGEWLIENCALIAAGENFMNGGNNPPADQQPSDITFRYCYFYKPPEWNSNHGSYAGVEPVVKNLFELKFGSRILLDWCMFDGFWPPDQDSWLNIKAVANSGSYPQASTTDFILRHCRVRNTGGSSKFAGQQESATGEVGRWVIAYTHVEGIGDPVWGGTGDSKGHIQYSTPDCRVIHCNLPHNRWGMVSIEGTNNDFVFQDNIITHGTYGVKAGGISTGNASLNAKAPNATFTGNLIRGGNSGNYPAGNNFVVDWATAGLEDSTVADNYGRGDSRLRTDSAYKTSASDGTEPGVGRAVWAQLDAMETAVVAGTSWSP